MNTYEQEGMCRYLEDANFSAMSMIAGIAVAEPQRPRTDLDQLIPHYEIMAEVRIRLEQEFDVFLRRTCDQGDDPQPEYRAL